MSVPGMAARPAQKSADALADLPAVTRTLTDCRPSVGWTKTTVCGPGATSTTRGALPRGRPSSTMFEGGIEVMLREPVGPATAPGAGNAGTPDVGVPVTAGAGTGETGAIGAPPAMGAAGFAPRVAARAAPCAGADLASAAGAEGDRFSSVLGDEARKVSVGSMVLT